MLPTRILKYNLFLTLVALVAASSVQAATPIYRSVGPGSSSALVSGGPNQLTLSGMQATFGSNLPNLIGVGDYILYDSDNDGTPDAAAFIHGRTDNRNYTVCTATGGTPTAIAGSDDDWAIYRAYLSLNDAEDGNENWGIPGPFQFFETHSGGKNLMVSDEVWNIACYADAPDTDAWTTIGGWMTDATHYIRIYTPHLPSEVGVSQRHNGSYSMGGYRIELSNSEAIQVVNRTVRIEGLQFRWLSLTNSDYDLLWINVAVAPMDIRVSHCIFRGVTSSPATGNCAVRVSNNGAGGTLRFWNNLFYDFIWSSNDVDALEVNNFATTNYVYNNTFVDCNRGLRAISGTYVAKNNLTQGCNDGFSGIFDPSSDYNCSDIPGDPPGSNSNTGTANFINAGADDFHLSTSDTVARNTGINLSGDVFLPFSDDIDVETRSGTWDKGADEASGAPSTPTFTPTVTSTQTQGNTPTFTSTRTATPTRTVTLTATPQYSATHTPTRTATPTRTLSRTATSSATITETNTPGPSATVTPTVTDTPVISPTATPTVTPSATPSQTRTITLTRTDTPSPTISQTRTITPTITMTFTPTPSLTISVTSTEVPLVVDDIVAYPQPATGDTAYFYYKLDQPARLEILIYNVLGERVITLKENKPGVGYERTLWNIRDAAPGVYLYRLRIYPAGGGMQETKIKKLVIVKLSR